MSMWMSEADVEHEYSPEHLRGECEHFVVEAKARLEELRALINAEPPERGISQGELLELESLAEFIEPDDVELLQWAGVPEFVDATGTNDDRSLNDLTEGQVLAYNKRNDDPILTCDLCGQRERSGDLTPDWNGETGNHKSCEREAAVRYDEDKWDREASR